MNKSIAAHRKGDTMNPQPVTVRKNACVDFSAITISGDVLCYEDRNPLVLIDEMTSCPERLSVNLEAYKPTPHPATSSSRTGTSPNRSK